MGMISAAVGLLVTLAACREALLGLPRKTDEIPTVAPSLGCGSVPDDLHAGSLDGQQSFVN